MSKSFASSVVDSVRNLLRHGSLHAPPPDPKVERSLIAVRDEVRHRRHRDPIGAIELLDRHEHDFRASGQSKFLAINYYLAGHLGKAAVHVRRVATDRLPQTERALVMHIRRETRAALFGRKSRKPIALRLAHGVRNLLRHGSIYDPHARHLTFPHELRAVSERIKALRGKDAGEIGRLLDEHEDMFIAADRRKFLALSYYHAGRLEKAAEHAAALDEAAASQREAAALANIAFEWRALRRMRAGENPIALAPRGETPPRPADPLRALYLAASSRPHLISGYTTRSEMLVMTLDEAEDLSIVALTRPGFPEDRPDARANGAPDVSAFRALPSPMPYKGDLEAYLETVLPTLEAEAREAGIHLVHGVSNYRNAVIGLALARRLGCPFVYEIRGLWEETASTKIEGFRGSERFEFERAFERWLVAQADGILPINAPVRDAIAEVPHRNAAILPNCVSRGAIRTRTERSDAEPRGVLRLGYVGSLLEYEGIDDVLHALDTLRERGVAVRFDIYGDGVHREALEGLASDLDLGETVAFHGWVEPSATAALYDGFDLVVCARKPYRVCQLVTPMKPVEAMANDVVCLLSDVAPLAALAQGGETALSFAAGDIDDLARAIAEFADWPEDRREDLRDRARTMLEKRYVWEAQQAKVAAVYRAAFSA